MRSQYGVQLFSGLEFELNTPDKNPSQEAKKDPEEL